MNPLRWRPAQLWDVAAAPWSLSMKLLGRAGGDPGLWRGTVPARRLSGRPLEVLLETFHTGAVTASWMCPREDVGFRELRNKIEAFAYFHQGGELARRGQDVGTSLGPYHALWAKEGRGFEEAGRGSPVEGDLVRASGLGLALAIRLVADRTRSASQVVEGFVAAVDEATHPGVRLAALENLGLAVRTLRPESLVDFHRSTLAAGGDLAELFWHGIGRGLYFTPTQVAPLPGRRWSAWERVLSEPVGEAGRRNAVAGLAWALTLVNVRHPRVVERRLRPLAESPEARPWVAQGMASALMIWCTH